MQEGVQSRVEARNRLMPPAVEEGLIASELWKRVPLQLGRKVALTGNGRSWPGADGLLLGRQSGKADGQHLARTNVC